MPKRINMEWERKVVGGAIRELRESLGLSTREFSDGIPGLRSSNLSQIERGLRPVPHAMLFAIGLKFRQPMGWPYDRVATRTAHNLNIRAVPILSAQDLAGVFGNCTKEPEVVPMRNQYVSADVKDRNAFALVVYGEQMAGPPVDPGDILLVEPGEKVKDGDLVIAIRCAGGDPEEPFVCKVSFVPQGTVLYPIGYAKTPKLLAEAVEGVYRLLRIGEIRKPI